MTDRMSREQRSRSMASVKGKDTKPEMIVRKFLFSKGLRYRLHDKKLIGHPDIVLKKYKTVIFIDGCFWHGHDGCKFFKIPKSNVFYWENKIRKNKARDISADYVLQTEGWRVIRLWECELMKLSDREESLENLYKRILHPTYESPQSSTPSVAEHEAPYNKIFNLHK